MLPIKVSWNIKVGFILMTQVIRLFLKKFSDKFLVSPSKTARSFDLNFRFAYMVYTFSLLPQLKIKLFLCCCCFFHLKCDYFSQISLDTLSSTSLFHFLYEMRPKSKKCLFAAGADPTILPPTQIFFCQISRRFFLFFFFGPFGSLLVDFCPFGFYTKLSDWL